MVEGQDPMINKTPEELGFVPGVPGHRLAYVNLWNPNNQSAWSLKEHRFACSCGVEVYVKETQKGVGTRALRTWRDHITAVSANPDEIFEVGTIEKMRVTWDVKVMHRDNQHAAAYGSNSRYYQGWTDVHHQHYPYYAKNPWGLVVDRTSTKSNKVTRVLERVYESQPLAVRYGLEMLRKAEESGHAITYSEGTPAVTGTGIVVPTFRNTFSELLERTDTALSGDLQDVEETMQELDEVLGLIPVLQARREELASIWESRTVGLLSK